MLNRTTFDRVHEEDFPQFSCPGIGVFALVVDSAGGSAR